ncbi:1-acyl-sn-glycerol-3-phosphate acyltransferase [Halomonas cupida]|uniref:1-acyl-sn-glycerol-3-phosphate acyltransferase n=1 Tax=Halomonas cupida TaxID=44933 RepID=UPI003A8ED6D3
MNSLFIWGVGTLLVVAYIWHFTRQPAWHIRGMVYALIHVMYRLRFQGRSNIPSRGPALVVCNHVSFVDALVMGGGSPRPLRFLMDKPIYESKRLNWLFRMVGAIPVESDRSDPGNVRRALDEVSRALRNGDIVMLFPEGRLTPDGETHTFRRGLDLILRRDPVPVIPAALSGLWGSWTSHAHGRALSRWPRRFRARVALYFGEPIAPGQATRQLLEQQVLELKRQADEWGDNHPSESES